MSYLKLQVIGNLGNDAILKETNGLKVLNFNVAHTERFKTKEGVAQEKTTWLSCSYWSEKAGIAPYLKKGTLVLCEGVPEVSLFDAKDGTKKVDFRLRVSIMQLLGGSKQEGQTPGTGNQVKTEIPAAVDTEDDLPF